MLYVMYWLFVILSVLDAVTTYKALQKPGTREANPVIAFSIKKLGLIPGLIVPKAVAIIGIWFLLHPDQVWLLAVINAVYLYVVWNNYRFIRK